MSYTSEHHLTLSCFSCTAENMRLNSLPSHTSDSWVRNWPEHRTMLLESSSEKMINGLSAHCGTL